MRHQKVTRMVLAAMFAAITAVASQIIFPLGFTPVPFSCAMIAIYLCGALLDPRTAFLSQLAYLLAGAAGAPVFSYFSGGLHKLAGPTGGYLFVYPLMALAVSAVTRRWGRGFFKYCAAMTMALALCYAVGTAWFMFVSGTGLAASLVACVAPFVPMDAVKILLSAALASALSRALGKARLLGTGI